jgi:osmoprotectant transport system permease protein
MSTTTPDLQQVDPHARPDEVAAAETTARARVVRYLAMPLFLAAILVVLYLVVQARGIDGIEARTLNWPVISRRLWQHIVLTGVAALFLVALAVPTGILLTRTWARRAVPYVVAVANIGQATPSIGVLVLLALVFGIGFDIAIVGLVAYGFLPILRNTMVGLQQVDASVIEAGRGMGMTKRAVLWRIEMPLAVPVILAGIRTALIITAGTATLATFIGAGGLGAIIDNGLALNRPNVLWTGAILTACLALFIDYIAGIAEEQLRPRGL